MSIENNETTFRPKIVAFCCNWCSYAGADLAGSSRLSYPADVKIKDYDKDFIDGCLIGAWQQVYGMIREMKEKQEVPFNN